MDRQSRSTDLGFDFDGKECNAMLLNDLITFNPGDLLYNTRLTSPTDSTGRKRSRDETNHHLPAPSYPPLSTRLERGTVRPETSVYDSATSTGPYSPRTMDAASTGLYSNMFPGSKQPRGDLDTLEVAASAKCSCLQQQVHLVYQLGELQSSRAGEPALDRALQGIHLAQESWKILMKCSKCQRKESQDEPEAFKIFRMSIRLLLSSVQDTILDRSVSGAPDMRVLVGSFELTGETKNEVIRVAVRRALGDINSALLYMWERAGISKTQSSMHFGDSSRSSSIAPESPAGSIDNTHLSSASALLQEPTYAATFGSEISHGSDDLEGLLDSIQQSMQAMQQTSQGL